MGTEINNEALAAALREQTQLTDDVLAKFNVPPLTADCYIKVGEVYFKPEIDRPLIDDLIHCNIAWFLDVLKGDGDPNSTDFVIRRKGKGPGLHVPLYKAVLQAQAELEVGKLDGRETETLQVATRSQIDEVAEFLADRIYQDQYLVDTKFQQTSNSYAEAYVDEISTISNEIRTMLTSPQFIFLNVHSPTEVAEALVRQIVKLDRLPRTNSAEGLQLLQEAWCEYDVAMHLANRYKMISKMLYILQLVLGWAVVFVGTAEKEFADKGVADTSDWRHIVFGLTLGAAVLMSFDSLTNAKTRWRQLRSSAGLLESLLYLYRTRVGQFELDPLNADSRQPESALCSALKKWRSDLVAAADLQLSSLKKQYPDTIYSHEQTAKARRPRNERGHSNTTLVDQPIRSGGDSADATNRGVGQVVRKESEVSAPPARDVEKALARGPISPQLDDFYSPLTPEVYLDIRIKQSLAFYKRRIPQYAHDRYIVKAILILLTSAASAISAYGLSVWALVIASAATAITSWTEFADTSRKVERYTKAVVELENLISHWKSLTEVEKASPVTIYNVVLTGESIISDERVAWLSTAQKSSTKDSEGQSSTKETEGRQTATTNKVQPL